MEARATMSELHHTRVHVRQRGQAATVRVSIYPSNVYVPHNELHVAEINITWESNSI